MLQNVMVSLMVLAVVLPLGGFLLSEGRLTAVARARRFKHALFVNIVSFFGVMLFSAAFIFISPVFAAETISYAQTASDQGMKYLAAGLSTGLATIGAGVATGSAASAALGALSENDAIMGRALIFVALAEGIAIYGLLISFMILNQ